MEMWGGRRAGLELIRVAAQRPQERPGLPAGGSCRERDGPGDIWPTRSAVTHGVAGECLRGRRNTFSCFLRLKSHDALIIVRQGKSWFLSSSSSLLSPPHF